MIYFNPCDLCRGACQGHAETNGIIGLVRRGKPTGKLTGSVPNERALTVIPEPENKRKKFWGLF